MNNTGKILFFVPIDYPFRENSSSYRRFQGLLRLLVSGITVALLNVFPANAGTVILDNSDTISGDIKKIENGKLLLRTEAMGDVNIQLDYVRTFSTDKEFDVKTQGGEVLKGKIRKSGSGEVIVLSGKHKSAQRLSLKDIKVLGEFPDPVELDFRFSTGVSGSEGNSELFNLNINTYLRRRSEESRVTVDGIYLYETDDGSKSKDEWYVDLKYDFFFTEKVYGFSTVRAQQDDVAQLNLRLSLSPGLGYQWTESEGAGFSTEAGPAYLYENFSNGNSNNSKLTGRLAYFLDRKIIDRVDIFHNTKYFPELKDPTDMYVITVAGLRSDITERLFTEAKLTVEHDTTPADDAEDTDLYYTVGVGMSF